jgi:hypothetical protein
MIIMGCRDKSGQIFLMGAMLFVLIFFSLVAINNSVMATSSNYHFNYLAQNIKAEMVRVIEHDIKNSENNLEDFINLTAGYLEKSYPGARFIFIYGDRDSNMTLRNYTNGVLTSTLKSQVGNNITIELNGVNYVAEVYPSTQVYFAIEKIEGNDVFVSFA